jgi:hypothetical protein
VLLLNVWLLVAGWQVLTITMASQPSTTVFSEYCRTPAESLDCADCGLSLLLTSYLNRLLMDCAVGSIPFEASEIQVQEIFGTIGPIKTFRQVQ